MGEVLGTEGIADAGLSGDWVLVETKNHFAVGDLIEVVHPSGNTTVRLQEMRNVEGQPVQVAQGSPCACGFRCLRAIAVRCWRGSSNRNRLRRPQSLHSLSKVLGVSAGRL